MKRENRKWANRIKKAEQGNKNLVFIDACDDVSQEDLLQDIVKDIPRGHYHLNSGEMNSISDMLWSDYGMMVSCFVDCTFFIGLSIFCDSGRKVNGKKFHASFTHDLNKITIS